MPRLVNPRARRKVLRAVQPNPGVQEWFRGELVSLLQEAHADAVITLTQAWTAAPPTVGIAMDAPQMWYSPPREDYQHGPDGEIILTGMIPGEWIMAYDAPSSTVKLNKALKKWGDKWRGRFDQLSEKLSKKFTTRVFNSTDTGFKAALKEAGFTVSFKPTAKSLESYKLVVADNVGLIRNLQTSLYSKIQQDTWASVRAGADMHTLATKLQHSYGIEEKRAALIARDQNAKAKAVLETTRRQELGLKRAIWQHSSAGKEPRPNHVRWGKERLVFDLDKGVYDDEAKEYVFPGQLINCRCTSRAIVPGYNDDEDTADE